MRSGDPGWEVTKDGAGGTWRVGDAVDAGWVNNRSWGTPFTGFRFAVPELCHFEGKAIYLDADMLVLGDIAELWEQEPEMGRGIRCWGPLRTDVSVIQCDRFHVEHRDKRWPTIERMKPSGWRAMDYLRRLHSLDLIDPGLDPLWNDCDGMHYEKGANTKLLHYTHVLEGQPYRPYPNVRYPKEFPFVTTSKQAGNLWWDFYLRALMQLHGEDEGTRVWQEAKSA